MVFFDSCRSLIRIWVGKARWSGNWDEGFGGVQIYEGVTTTEEAGGDRSDRHYVPWDGSHPSSPIESRQLSWKECRQTPNQSHQECPRVLSLARYCFLYISMTCRTVCIHQPCIILFDDDCLIYREIHSQQDNEDLQTGLDALQTC